MRGSGTGQSVSEAELHGFADGELDRDREDAVRAYLATSPADAARVETWRRQKEVVQSGFPLDEPPFVPWPALPLPGNGAGSDSKNWRERWFVWLIMFVFASGALFAWGAAHVASRLAFPEVASPSPGAPAPGAASDFMAAKALAALREFAAPPSARLTSALPRPEQDPAVPILPVLPDEDLKLAGVRAMPGGLGDMLCLYYSKPDGGIIGLCVEKAAEQGETLAQLVGKYPAAAVHWRQKGGNYAVLGPLQESELWSLAGGVRAQIEAFDPR